MLGTALRDTLARQGIPAAWLSPETLVTTSRSREPRNHLRLLIRPWDARVHAVALQNALGPDVTQPMYLKTQPMGLDELRSP